MVGELDGDWPGALRFVEKEEELDRKSEYIDVTDTLFSLDMFSAPCLNLSGAFDKVSLVYRDSDAVGTPITERPPHRTVRADFPHTALHLG